MDSNEIREWDSDQDSDIVVAFESPKLKPVYVNVPNDSPPRDPDASVNKTHFHESTPVSPPPQDEYADVNTSRVEPFVDDSRLDLNPAAEGTMPFDDSVGTVKFTKELPSPDKTFNDFADAQPSNVKELRRVSQGDEKERYRPWEDMTLEEPKRKTDEINGLCPACFAAAPLVGGLAKCEKCWGICLQCFGEDLLSENKCKACSKA